MVADIESKVEIATDCDEWMILMDEFSCYDDGFRSDFVTVVIEHVGSHSKVAGAGPSVEVE